MFSNLGSFKGPRWAILGLIFLNLLGCANAPEDTSESFSPLSVEQCEEFASLWIDPEFQTFNTIEGGWRFEQHVGEQSFYVSLDGAELAFSRIGSEPWGLVTQRVTDSRLSGRIVRFSAELKGNVSSDTVHGFPAKSGLFLRVGPLPDAVMADHEPNVGQWDWQRVTVEKAVPEIFDYIEIGFIYQAGEGTLIARAPRISLAECSD